MISIPSAIQSILTALRSRGHEACPVGGCVRDSLRGVEPEDWDICTSAIPEETMSCFPEGDTIPTGIKHGTVTVRSGGVTSEVTTYRTEGEYSDGRRPDSVTFVRSLSEDLRRRDFTVNAMALDEAGEVIDLFGGQADLSDHLVRCVGEPNERFQEDALRILRALRFASKLDFGIEAKTGSAVMQNRALLYGLSAERVWKELKGILVGPGCGRVLRNYSAVLAILLPELGTESIERRSAAIAAAPADLCLRMALLLFGLDGQKSAEILKRLHCDNATRSRTLDLKEALEAPLPRTREGQLKLAQKLGWADALLVAGLRDKKYAAELKTLQAENPCLTVHDLCLSGDDLMRLGAPTGEVIGAILRLMLGCVWRKEAENTRESLLPLAHKMLHTASVIDAARTGKLSTPRNPLPESPLPNTKKNSVPG